MARFPEATMQVMCTFYLGLRCGQGTAGAEDAILLAAVAVLWYLTAR